jgi:hypothetical protein
MLSETQIVLDFIGGADVDRTRDLLNAIQALSQLSYSPTVGARPSANRKLSPQSIEGTMSGELTKAAKVRGTHPF